MDIIFLKFQSKLKNNDNHTIDLIYNIDLEKGILY